MAAKVYPKPYDFTVEVDGDDLVVTGIGTRFGGADDGQDNGVGARGFPVRLRHDFWGVSLPIHSVGAGLGDSPLPALPIADQHGNGGQHVRVYSLDTHEQSTLR